MLVFREKSRGEKRLFLFFPGGFPFHQLQNFLLGNGSLGGCRHFAVLKEETSGEVFDVVFLGKSLRFGGVDHTDFHIRHFLRQRFHHSGKFFTVMAPVRIEIHQYRDFRFQNLSLKTRLCQRNDFHYDPPSEQEQQPG